MFTAIDELKFKFEIKTIAFRCCYTRILENHWKQIEGRSSTSNSTCCIDVRLFTGNSFTCDIALDVVDQSLVIRNWILDRYCISLEIPITKDLLGRCVSAGVVLHLLDDIDTRSTSLYEHPDSRIAMDFCSLEDRGLPQRNIRQCCIQPYADRGLVCDYCQEHQLLPDSVKAEIIDQAPLSALEIEDAYLSKKSGLPDVAISLTSSSWHDPLTYLSRHESLVIVVRRVVQLISPLPRLTHTVITFIRQLDIQVHSVSDEDHQIVKAFDFNAVIASRLFCIKTASYKRSFDFRLEHED